jgi:bla regulator protein BlaR1
VLVLLSIAAIGVPILIGVLDAPALRAQDATATTLEFEVASVKQNTSGDGRVQIQILPGNRINMTNVPARFLVAQAYQLQQFQLVGGPSWLTTDRYDIVAKLAGEQKPIVPGTPNPVMLALRPLLTDRFKLKLHRETRDMDVYALVMVKPGVLGSGLKPSSVDCAAQAANARRNGPPAGPPPAPPGLNDPFPCGLGLMPGMIRLGGMPIGQLTQTLTGQSGRLVLDRTGLTGNWDVTLRFALEPVGGPPPAGGVNVSPVDPDAPSLFTALQEQLGLKLESTKAPVDVTVIDSIEHPTDN